MLCVPHEQWGTTAGGSDRQGARGGAAPPAEPSGDGARRSRSTLAGTRPGRARSSAAARGRGGDPRRGGRTRPLLFLLRAAASTARVSGFCRAASRARGGLFPRSAAPGAGLLLAVAGCCAPCRAGGLARPAPGRFRRGAPSLRALARFRRAAPSLRAQRALGAKRRPCARSAL